MSETLFADRPLADALAEADAIVRAAVDEHEPSKTFILFSGGNDSLVLLDAMQEFADAIVHINTGIGIPEAHEFARGVAARYMHLEYIEKHPPKSYDELVLEDPLWDGLPGPGFHNIVYQRLKERCIREVLADHRSANGQRFLFLSGIRRAESKRRMKRRDVTERDGGRVLCKPLFHWSNQEMWEYRLSRDLPVNPVAANLHMSGECLCGAMANQDDLRSEREAIKFFYPEFDARLSALEAECRRRGKTYCEWGVKQERPTLPEDAGQLTFEPLCQSCAWQSGGAS